MDALSDILRVVRLTGGVFLDAEFTAPWCIAARVGPEDCRPFFAQPQQVIAYHYVVSGRLMLEVENAPPIAARAGEIILLPSNAPHRLGSDLGLLPIIADHLVEVPSDGGLARIVHGGGGEATHIVCGFLGSEQGSNPLIAMLPSLLTLDTNSTGARDWVESSFRFAATEAAAGRIGSATVLSKLSELLFVEAVRHYVAGLPAEQLGWLAGLRDRFVGRALALLHERIAHPWTADELALSVGLSRSAFAQRFTTLIGEPPMHYLTSWRMQVAAQRLRESQASVGEIAFAVGYESEAAFHRAFKRAIGTPPATWRKRRKAAADT